MELIKPNINIDFVGRRKMAICFSLLLILVGTVLTATSAFGLYKVLT